MNNSKALKTKRTHKGLWITLISVFTIIIIILAAFFIYAGDYNRTTEEGKTYLQSDEKTTVNQEKDYITFTPASPSDSGFIFYPGGKVEYTAYAPMMKELSDKGISGVLVKMPFNLAVFNQNAANGKQGLFPKVTDWYIGGHSLGGVMASSYLGEHGKNYHGLILLASYSTYDLSPFTSLRTLSLLASNDQVLKKEQYEKNRMHLPNLTEKTIEGGIHSYFGDYGIQKGDGTPAINVQEQRYKTVAYISSFIFEML